MHLKHVCFFYSIFVVTFVQITNQTTTIHNNKMAIYNITGERVTFSSHEDRHFYLLIINTWYFYMYSH